MLDAQALQLSLQERSTSGDVLLTLLAAEELPDLLAGAAGAHVAKMRVQPISAGAAPFGREDLHLIAVPQLIVQGNDLAVHLRPLAKVADLRMHAVGEIDGRRSSGQFDDVSLGREDVDLLGEEVCLQRIHEFLSVHQLPAPVHQLAQPGHLGLEHCVPLHLLFVSPVGGDSILRHAVHLPGADLDLQRVPLRPHHRRVEGLIHVVLGHGDVVIELASDGTPQRMHYPQGSVAVLDVVYDHPRPVHVVDTIEVPALLLHLLIDAGDVLPAPRDLGLDTFLYQAPLQRLHHTLDVPFAIRLMLSQQSHYLAIGVRLQIPQGQVLQLLFDLPHTQSVRQWRKDLQGLHGDQSAPVLGQRLQGAHVVQAVRQPDEDDPDIVDHRQENLAEALGLLFFQAGPGDLPQLGHAVHQPGDLLAEDLLYILHRHAGVFRDIVEQARGDGGGVEAQIDQGGSGGQ